MTEWSRCSHCLHERRLSDDGTVTSHNVYIPPDWSSLMGSMSLCPGAGLYPIEAE